MHGPFKNKIHQNSEIYFSKSQDENHPLYMIMETNNPNTIKTEIIIDKYDVAGSPPHVESLFFYKIKENINAISIISWEINSRGIGTYGKLYQIFSYKNKDGELTSNNTINLDSRMSGLDGHQDGEKSEFKLKTANDVKKFINENLK
ncbi:hypothetical protein D3C78_1134970 [compost metagenome]